MDVSLDDFKEDITFLKTIQSALLQTCQHEKRDEITQIKNQTARIILPLGFGSATKLLGVENYPKEKPIENAPLYGVGFIGFKNKDIPHDVQEKLEVNDLQLVQEFKHHPNIIAYVSAKQTKSENWGNLVVFNDVSALDRWHSSQLHARVIKYLSPQVYSHVRIHFGRLSLGLCNPMLIERTVFIDYKTTDTNFRRRVVHWDKKVQDK